jgi:hypothetical protein
MNHSTGTSTKAEASYIEAIKNGFCIACLIWEQSDESPPMFVPQWGCDCHHLKSGNVRVGHFWSVGLCAYHHRGVPLEGWNPKHMRKHFGPSLMDGSRTFHDVYGSDADLLAAQDEALRDWGIEPPVRPENRRWSHAA